MGLRVSSNSITSSLLSFTKSSSSSYPSSSILSFHSKPPFTSTSLFRSYCSTSSMPSSHSLAQIITLPGQPDNPIHLTAAPGISLPEFKSAIESSLFQKWLENLQGEQGALTYGTMSLNKVLIQGVDYFGKRVGFVKFKADIVDKEMGRKVPGIVFARGPAVAILILLQSEDETFAILTEQVRVPTGRFVLELPAGMLDDDKGDFVGTAVREVEEETGIHLNVDDMVDLTAFLDPSTGCKIFPSPGGCDEEISVYLYKGQVSMDTIKELQGKETGLHEHGELIKLHILPYSQLWRSTADAKVLMAIALYEMAIKEGLLPKS